MAQEYKVQAVSGETRNFDTKFGTMTSYKVKLEGVDTPVELAQKSTTPAPAEGQTLFGHIEESSFGPKFKKEQQGFGGSASSATGVRASGGSGAKRESDPFTMYLSYAKDVAVALIATKEGFSEEKFGEILEAVVTGGKTLYNERPGAEPTQATDNTSSSDEDVDEMKKNVADFFGAKPEDVVDLS